jgi:Bifunctional DNA primase/polymerase, N-terminal
VDNPVLGTALGLAARGWPVFPCRPGGKEPAVAHGFKDATTDPRVIEWWWERMPTANLAIATGMPAVDVLDIDRKAGVDGTVGLERLRRAGLLAGALGTVRTPSGGVHVYYRGTLQSNGALRGHGVDFRGHGGYVLVPPSVVDDRPYTLLEWRSGARGQALDWDRCRRLLIPPSPTRDRPAPTGGDVTALARWLARQPEGSRNNSLYWASCRAVESGHESELDVLVAAALQAGLDEREARRTVASAARRLGPA